MENAHWHPFTDNDEIGLFLRQRLRGYVFEPLGNLRIDVVQRRERLVDDLVGNGSQRIAAEWLPPRQAFVQTDPQGKDVGTTVDRRASNLLGRHVIRGAKELPGGGQVASDDRRAQGQVSEVLDGDIVVALVDK